MSWCSIGMIRSLSSLHLTAYATGLIPICSSLRFCLTEKSLQKSHSSLLFVHFTVLVQVCRQKSRPVWQRALYWLLHLPLFFVVSVVPVGYVLAMNLSSEELGPVLKVLQNSMLVKCLLLQPSAAASMLVKCLLL